MTDRPLNIGITCYPTYGGSGVVATELGLQLARRGHDIHFISYDKPFRFTGDNDRATFHKVQVVEYPLFQYPPYSLALTTKMVEVAQQNALDILHVHYAIPHAVSAYLAKQMMGGCLRVVTTLHGTDITLVGGNPTYMPITRFALEQSCCLTAVSEFLKEETIETFGISNPITVIPNFVDTDIFVKSDNHGVRKKYAPNDEKIVMHTSNFRPVKRLGDIVDAFTLVHQEIPSKLLLVGDGPDRYMAEQRAKEYNISADVVFLGKQQSIAELFSIADVYFLPSETESFGLSALEAMSCAVPVVATCAGGLPELVEHAQTGYLCCVGDTTEMAEAIKLLLDDDRRRISMGKKARQYAVERFNVKKITEEYEAFYWDLLDSNNK
jgi:N-acetyl-alpha-D-glucosaminyl L-malate synthase BshA